MKIISIALFGMLGVLARYYLGLAINRSVPTPFPWSTFIINILGSLAIGVVYALSVDRTEISENLRLGLTVGFLGGFTTFSSYSFESVVLFQGSEKLLAMLYLFVSPILGFSAALSGIILTRIIIKA